MNKSYCSMSCNTSPKLGENTKSMYDGVFEHVGYRLKKSKTGFVKSGKLFIVNCEFCGNPTSPKTTGDINRQKKNMGGVFCKPSCSHGNAIPTTCETCGGEIKKSYKKNGKWSRFCSKTCYSVWQMSSENIKEKHPNWKGGKYGRNHKSPEERRWSRQVKEKFNYTCQKCFRRGCKLVSHHLYCWSLYENKRYDVDNGVTLCTECHKFVHSNNNTTNLFIHGNKPDCRNKKYTELSSM